MRKEEDCRDWNEDWAPGDTAQCVVDRDQWGGLKKSGGVINKGQKLTVTGVLEAVNNSNQRAYFLWFQEAPGGYACQHFKKIKPMDMTFPEVVRKIILAEPARDKVLEVQS